MAPSLKKKSIDEQTDAAVAAATKVTPVDVASKRKRAPTKKDIVAETKVTDEPAKKRAPRKMIIKETAVADSVTGAAKPSRNANKEIVKNAVDTDDAVATDTPVKTRKKVTTKATATTEIDSTAESPRVKVKKVAHQVLTERDELPKLWDADKARANGSHTFKIASWNVAGLRALLKNHPNSLAELVNKYDLDVLCLQETKLQEMHLDDPKLKIRGHLLVDEGYDAYYSCSTEKKGYSGTAVFIKRRGNTAKKQKTLDSFFGGATAGKPKEEQASGITNLVAPVKVALEMGHAKHDTEGRLIYVEFPLFSICNVYVPNSGQDLKRLQYRIGEWDTDLLATMERLQKERGVPLMWLGDLNVAHTHLEVWNDGAKHLPKQAGVTPEERASFQRMLDSGWIDAFRRLHPMAKGHYSYWSQRAGNREPNKGLRLDYFICHPTFFDEASNVIVRDSYMAADHIGSDHCPVILEMEIKG